MSTLTSGMIHTVFFWLKDSLSEEGRQDFVRAARELRNAATVAQFLGGGPSGTPHRDVTDHSFDYSIHLFFDSVEKHNAYQVDPVHLKFVETQEHKFAAVKVYDSEF